MILSLNKEKQMLTISALLKMNYNVTLYAVIDRGAAVTFRIFNSVLINQFLTD